MIEKIAVIGAGPGGLAAAKYLIAEHAFSEIVIFEQRLNVGGVWNATPAIRTDKYFTIPQTMPSTIPSEPVQSHGVEGDRGKLEFLSPIYNNLDTNIPQMLMKYSDHAFPEGTSLFPQHDVVLEYMERYGDEIRHLIRFGTQVIDVRPVTEDCRSEKWSVSTKDLRSGVELVSIFDAVIVANGHYNDPYVPDIPGIREWNARYPGSISHSKFYRKPDDFNNKKVLIIGNSASGTDLATQIAPTCSSPLLISSRSPPTQFLPSTSPSAPTVALPEIAHFSAFDHSIHFKNSHIEKDIDGIIFCTGYLYSFPFLTSLTPPLIAPDSDTPSGTITAPIGTRVHNLYQHIFYRPRPTLSFIALPQRIIPFPLSESQASIIARHLSGRLPLPSDTAMAAWEHELLLLKRRSIAGGGGGGEGKFHLLGYPEDAEYINFLHEWALRASPIAGTHNPAGVSGGPGKIPPYWGERERWMRERTPLIKKAAREVGARRRGEISTLEELGFDFGAWKREREGVGEVEGEGEGEGEGDGEG